MKQKLSKSAIKWPGVNNKHGVKYNIQYDAKSELNKITFSSDGNVFWVEIKNITIDEINLVTKEKVASFHECTFGTDDGDFCRQLIEEWPEE